MCVCVCVCVMIIFSMLCRYCKICVCGCMFVNVCMCVCMYVSMYVCMYICMYELCGQLRGSCTWWMYVCGVLIIVYVTNRVDEAREINVDTVCGYCQSVCIE